MAKLKRLVPDHPEVMHLEGVCLISLGRHAEALTPLNGALRAKPNNVDLLNAIGSCHAKTGDHEGALETYARALSITPNDPRVRYNLANSLSDQGRLDEAIETYRQALTGNDAFTDAWSNLAQALKRAGRLDEACDAYRRAVETAPEDDLVWEDLGFAEFFLRHDPDAAMAALTRAAALNSKNASARLGLGLLAVERCDPDAAARSLLRTAKGQVRPDQLGNATVALNYLEDSEPADVLRMAKQWRKDIGTFAPLAKAARRPAEDGSLRLGIVCGHFRNHPVAYLLRPWVRHAEDVGLDITVFHTTAPSAEDRADWIGVSEWRDISDVSDQIAAEVIADAGPDVLMTPSGHLDDQRLAVFARRPAPVQVVGPSHCCTTGLNEIDAILSDRHQIPEGGERHYAERPLVLPDGYVCFDAPAPLPGVSPPDPAAGPVLGCFNNPSKIGRGTAALWSDLMDRHPTARLLLKNPTFDDGQAAANIRRLFADCGMADDRLMVEGGVAPGQLLEQYNRLHLALDPLGYSGGITTLEALWMGVPVITLPGRKFAARHSLTHLMNCGLKQFVASDEASYIAAAKAWLDDETDLVARKLRVREAIRNAPLSDGRRYARALKQALSELVTQQAGTA